MSYLEFKPHHSLQDKIDCYWTIHHNESTPRVRKIIPDGCVDIIINLGDKLHIVSENSIIENEAVILAGPMTQLKLTENAAHTNIIGIRFKPFGFHAFFEFGDLSAIQDMSMPLRPKDVVPDFKCLRSKDLIMQLDRFFLGILKAKSHYIQHIVHSLDFSKPLEVPKIASEHHVTERTLQRHFLKYAGMPLKRYYSIMRVQHALRLLGSGNHGRLSDIYYPLNFYDNAHFTKEFSRLTGFSPTAAQ
ncbi:AraC family transcriptional regulator [Chitinophaga caseinilytica]|uniref:AraC family transcriptional regulator n=1 Tax=Chitinophaga caseinilytica TaxID=2267521 RepID=A0ABZ2YXH6_9BACT